MGDFTSHKSNNKFPFFATRVHSIQILFLTFHVPLEFSLWASRLSVLFRIIIVPFVLLPSLSNSDFFCRGVGRVLAVISLKIPHALCIGWVSVQGVLTIIIKVLSRDVNTLFIAFLIDTDDTLIQNSILVQKDQNWIFTPKIP